MQAKGSTNFTELALLLVWTLNPVIKYFVSEFSSSLVRKLNILYKTSVEGN